jgi:hypothetical protein
VGEIIPEAALTAAANWLDGYEQDRLDQARNILEAAYPHILNQESAAALLRANGWRVEEPVAIRDCPFDDPGFDDLEPDVPCPVCGDLGTDDYDFRNSRCVSNQERIDAVCARPEVP